MKSNNIIWSWRDARLGTVIAAIPVVIIVTGNAEIGLPLLIGSMELMKAQQRGS